MSDAPLHASHVIRLAACGTVFPAGPGKTVLQAALDAGVRLPSSCRNGTCRACLCRLLSGDIVYRIEWPGLSADEKAEGLILPCVALPLSDLLIDQPAAARVPAQD